uniref:ENT domain-containing protein n=1 Tax=Aegilops tauschii subsp. strangulata TaxID=200361 RepID=A0A453L4S9_AEGTS
MNPMGYRPYDSSGTDDDLPSSQNRGLRGRSFSGNGRASAGPFPYARPHNDLESQVHLVEQEAYTGVLRAFKVQSDALSWEKESLISELRKELRVSDEEHRELLNKVNEDGAIRGMRELRQGGGTPSGLHRGSRVLHDGEPGPTAKRQRPSHLMPSHSSGLQSPVMSSHSVPSSSKWGPSSASRGKRAKSTTPLALPSMDPTSLISRKVFTRWPDDNNFYEATITRYNPATVCSNFTYFSP